MNDFNCKEIKCKHYRHIALDYNDPEKVQPAYCAKRENEKCPEIVKRVHAFLERHPNPDKENTLITKRQKTIYTVNDHDFDSLQHAKASFEWSIAEVQKQISGLHNSLKWENAQYESFLRASNEDFEREGPMQYNGITITKPSIIKYLKKLKVKETIKQYTKELKSKKQRYYSYISSLKEIEKRIREETENLVD